MAIDRWRLTPADVVKHLGAENDLPESFIIITRVVEPDGTSAVYYMSSEGWKAWDIYGVLEWVKLDMHANRVDTWEEANEGDDDASEG